MAVCSMVRSSIGNWRPGMCFHASRLILRNVRPTPESTRTRWMDLETTWGDEWHANSEPRFHRIPWSKDLGESFRVIWWVLWKKTSRRTSGSCAACHTRACCTFRHVSTRSVLWSRNRCHVPRTSAERDGTGRRDSANPRRFREPNGELNVNCWLNLKSATMPLNKYYEARHPTPTRIFLVSYTSVTSSPSYMATPMCFSANSVEPSTLVAL